MRALLARRRWGRAECGDGARAAPRCRPALPSSFAFLPSSPGAPGRRAAGGAPGWSFPLTPPCFLPGFNLSATPLPAPRKVQPLDRSVLAAGFGEEGGRRREERGGGKGEAGGGCSGGSGKLRAAFPPQSVEQERGGARRRRRLLRHPAPGLGATSSFARRNPLPIGFSLIFSSPFLSSPAPPPFPSTFFCFRTSDCCSLSLPKAQLLGASHPSGDRKSVV